MMPRFDKRRCFDTSTHRGQPSATLLAQVAHRDDFHVWMILKSKFRAEFAEAITNDADAQFAVGDGLPARGAACIHAVFASVLTSEIYRSAAIFFSIKKRRSLRSELIRAEYRPKPRGYTRHTGRKPVLRKCE